jgi:hypothetical protein
MSGGDFFRILLSSSACDSLRVEDLLIDHRELRLRGRQDLLQADGARLGRAHLRLEHDLERPDELALEEVVSLVDAAAGPEEQVEPARHREIAQHGIALDR